MDGEGDEEGVAAWLVRRRRAWRRGWRGGGGRGGMVGEEEESVAAWVVRMRRKA